MNYSNYKKDEILRLEDFTKLFEVLTNLDWKGHEATWADIFQGFAYYYRHKEYLDRQLPEYLKPEDIKMLECNYGLDINYIDGAGNNLMLFAATSLDFLGKLGGCPYNFNLCFDYILDKTDNIYIVNKYNENLVFQYTSYSKKDQLKPLLEKYKDFDLNLINSNGNNLLVDAIINRAPEETIKVFYDMGLDYLDVGKDKTSILYYVSYGAVKGLHREIFTKAFESLENPFKKHDDFGSFLELLVSDTNHSTWQVSKKWLNYTFKLISEDRYKLNKDTKEYLEELFKVSVPKEGVEYFDIAKSSFNKRVLEEDLNNKSDSKIKKIKI